jgi:DNA-binding CsgD family transcriptional regulator
MSVLLSHREIGEASDIIQLLLSPHDAASVDEWRAAANRGLKSLLHADSAGFLLPEAEGPLVYSDEHDPDSLDRFLEISPPTLSCGTTIFERGLQYGVGTLPELWGPDLDLYLRSAYYNEYAGANGAHDTLSGLIALGQPGNPLLAGMMFWHGNPRGRKFTERETSLFRLVFPALRAGIEAVHRFRRYRSDLIASIDDLGIAALVTDCSGGTIHRTSELQRVLHCDPEAERIEDSLASVAASVGGHTGSSRLVTLESQGQAQATLVTARASYRVSGSLLRSPIPSTPALVIVALERTSAVVREPDELREQYGLTAAEVRVATVLARGGSVADIAKELFISEHTVRRHTERIFWKTNSKSRAQLSLRILR